MSGVIQVMNFLRGFASEVWGYVGQWDTNVAVFDFVIVSDDH